MKFGRIFILALLTTISIEAVAQSDSILVTDKDTVAYRYTPISTVPVATKRNGWQRFVRYMVESEVDRSFEKRVDMTFVPALYYTPSTSLGLAVMAAGLYRIDKENRNISPSNFSVYATGSLTGFYRVGVSGTNIFKNDRQRLIYNAEFYSQPTLFWGVGYNAAMEGTRLKYSFYTTSLDVRFLQRAAKGLYVGVGADFIDFYKKFESAKFNIMATGISLLVEYDTRDVISNPHSGVYVALQAKVRPKELGNLSKTLWGGRLSANYYQKLWKGGLLALDLQAEINSEGTPWLLNAKIGGSSAMRGYYAGRFNDLCAVTLQAELRQKIYKGLGAAVWGGAGNVFPTLESFDWRETLPTYGVGLRYEIRRNINVRFDYGFGRRDFDGKLIHGAVFSLNEAF